MYIDHCLSEKLRIVALYESGLSSKMIGRELGVDYLEIMRWLTIYRCFGFSGFEKYPHTHPITEFKQAVIRSVLEKVFSCDAAVRERIIEIFLAHKGRYGYRRITQTLHNEGLAVNHKTVERLMKECGVKSRIRAVRYRSYKGEVGRIAPNILQREFLTAVPNCKWATDVTQINIGGTT